MERCFRPVFECLAKPPVLSASDGFQRLQILFISFVSFPLLSLSNAGDQLFLSLPSRRSKDRLPTPLQ